MSQNKANELLIDYKEALNRLSESLKEDINKNTIALDGTIQRFEFTFEIAWKLMRAILSDRGIYTNSPKMTIKESYRENLIVDGDGWIKILEDRNLTAHTYKQDLALEIYSRIKNSHINLLLNLEYDVKQLF